MRKNEDIALRELEAMRRALEVIRDLPPEVVLRVLSWLAVQLGVDSGAFRVAPTSATGSAQSTAIPSDPPALPGTLADLFATAAPESGPEKVLVVAYWIQERENAEGFVTLDVTRHLKELGRPIANTAATLNLLQTGTPRLVQQSKKTGTAKQARKLYRVTEAGRSRVRELIARGAER